MAFITLEDLVGTVEVVVFPRQFEKSRMLMEEGQKIFVKGRGKHRRKFCRKSFG